MRNPAEFEPIPPDATRDDLIEQRRAMSVADFCAVYGFSLRHYYDRIDEMPPAVRIGRRKFILTQSLAAWEADLLRKAEARERAEKREATA